MLDRLREYFEEVRGAILPILPELNTMFQAKLPHSDNLDHDQECYISIGHNFLLTIVADSLLYITEGICQISMKVTLTKASRSRRSDGCQITGKGKPIKKGKV